MQRLGGLLLILAGVSLGAYTFLPAPFDGEQALREVTRISAAPDRLPEAGRPAWVTGDAETAAPRAEPKMAALASTPPQDPAPIEDAKPSATWSAIVTADAAQQARITSSKPADGETRAQLTRDLQTELRRVGCYGGEVNGAWTPSTRRALSAFMERVNATLPMDEPDYILLTLVQGHSAKACGAGCPSGQIAAADGRCMPQGVVAARSGKKSKATVDVAAREPSADQQERRTAVGKGAYDSAKAGGSERIVAQGGESERLPWLDDDLSTPAPAPRPVRRPEGMMGVGAAQMAKADIPADPAPVTAQPSRRIVPDDDSPGQKQARAKAAPVLVPPNAEYQRGLPGSKSGTAMPRPKPPVALNKQKRKGQPQFAHRPAPLPPVIAKPAPKAKFYYFAGSGRRGQPRPGSPAFNMLQAMGGVY